MEEPKASLRRHEGIWYTADEDTFALNALSYDIRNNKDESLHSSGKIFTVKECQSWMKLFDLKTFVRKHVETGETLCVVNATYTLSKAGMNYFFDGLGSETPCFVYRGEGVGDVSLGDTVESWKRERGASNIHVEIVDCFYGVKSVHKGVKCKTLGVFHPKFCFVFTKRGLALSITTSNLTSQSSIEGTWSAFVPFRSLAERDDEPAPFGLHLQSFLESVEAHRRTPAPAPGLDEFLRENTKGLVSLSGGGRFSSLSRAFDFSKINAHLVATVPGRRFKNPTLGPPSEDEIRSRPLCESCKIRCLRIERPEQSTPFQASCRYGVDRMGELLEANTRKDPPVHAPSGPVTIQMTSVGDRLTETFFRGITARLVSEIQDVSEATSFLRIVWPSLLTCNRALPLWKNNPKAEVAAAGGAGAGAEDQTQPLPQPQPSQEEMKPDQDQHQTQGQGQGQGHAMPLTLTLPSTASQGEEEAEGANDFSSWWWGQQGVVERARHVFQAATDLPVEIVRKWRLDKDEEADVDLSEGSSMRFCSPSALCCILERGGERIFFEYSPNLCRPRFEALLQQQQQQQQRLLLDAMLNWNLLVSHGHHLKTWSRESLPHSEAEALQKQARARHDCSCRALDWCMLSSCCLSIGAVGHCGPDESCGDPRCILSGTYAGAMSAEDRRSFRTRVSYEEHRNFELGVMLLSTASARQYRGLDADCPKHGPASPHSLSSSSSSSSSSSKDVVLPLPYILDGRCYKDEEENMIIMPCLRYEDSPAHRRFLATAIAKFKLSPALLKEYRDRHESRAVARAARELSAAAGHPVDYEEAQEEEEEEEEEVEGERRQPGEGEWEEGVGGRWRVPRIKSEKVADELLSLYDVPPPAPPQTRASRAAGPGNGNVPAATGGENEVKNEAKNEAKESVSQGRESEEGNAKRARDAKEEGAGEDPQQQKKKQQHTCPLVVDSK